MVVRQRSSGLHAYVLTVSAVGFGSLALLARQGGVATVAQLPPVFWALLICLIVVESLPLVLPRPGNEVITTAETFAFAILLGWGTAAAAFAMTVALLISDVLRRADPEKVIFNIGQYGLLIAVSGGVYEALGAGHPFTADQLPAFVAAAAVFFLGNLLLMGGVTTLAYGRDFLADLKDELRVEARPYAMVFGMAPIMLVVAEQEVRLLPLLLLPLFAVRVAPESSWVKRSKMRSRSAGGTPGPLSSTASTARPPARRASTRIGALSGACLAALSSRPVSTWTTASGAARTGRTSLASSTSWRAG